MALVNKDTLKQKFQNGERPTQEDFADLIDSCYFPSAWQPIEGTNQSLLSVSTMARVGIGTDEPESSLHVVGGLKLGTGDEVNSINNSFPTTLELQGKSLPTAKAVDERIQKRIHDSQIDVPRLVFYGQFTNPTQFINGTIVPFTPVVLNPSATFEGNKIKVPSKGLYRIEATLYFAEFNAGSTDFKLKLRTSGGVSNNIFWSALATHELATFFVSVSQVQSLNAGTSIWIEVEAGNDVNAVATAGGGISGFTVTQLIKLPVDSNQLPPL